MTKKTNNSVYLKTFGCQMNKADSRRLEELLVKYGYLITDKKEGADIYVYNTCSVRDHAEVKALSHIGQLKSEKEKRPKIRICLVGCMAQRNGQEIFDNLPIVDLVIGPSTLFRLPLLLDSGETGVFLDEEDTLKEFSQYLDEIADIRRDFTGYVPIMKGCNNFCSYCIVPFVRGREQYRPVSDIIDECTRLAQKGTIEVMLLGQAINTHPEFKSILRNVASIEGLKRVMFVTSYPGFMDKEIVDIVSESPILSNYFHMPVQSGADRILEKMNRKYSISNFLDISEYIRETIPQAAVTTDLIVGFPGEEDEDFQKTLDLVTEVEFDQVFSFKYSPRPGTEAYSFDDNVPSEIKKKRLEELNNLCSKVSLKRNRRLVNSDVKVIAETKSSGRTDNYKIVHWENTEITENEIVDVRITEALPHSLKGKIVFK